MFNEIEAQTYLEQNYPTPADKINCQVLNLGIKAENNSNGLEVKLTGSLDLTGFVNLKELWCGGQNITSLNLQDCSKLEYLDCSKNQLIKLIFSSQLTNLETPTCHENFLTDLG